MNNRVKTFGRTSLVLAAAVAPVAGLAAPASAHGSMELPLSRVLACYQENPESPKSAACKAAVAAGGTQAFYDWNGVRIGDVAGRHRQVIPDGRLCSAGNPAFRGLDLPRADWPATDLKAGTDYTFRFKVTAVHRGGFQLFITKDGYDPTKPLTWASLETEPFLNAPDPTVSGGYYNLSGRIPAAKKGRHLIYAIWQRTDSPEAFYSCSDIVLGGGGTTAPTTPGDTAAPQPTKTAAPRPTPTRTRPTRPAKPTPSCHPDTTAHSSHHSDPTHTNLHSTPVAGVTDTPAQSPSTTALIGAIAGLTMGGLAGLLLTSRRRGTRRSHV
ncbi:lytic polysaccharide monooxygenase auxiliary activity family 9 protein [Actinocorallia populi]|uniref:lytic polysaccharide monooxygenase auxiliary activity family 9 protein n=1 Tax=Actinocorallia populi TaxID=2079200 RepID=UPI000D0891C5|nr:lytic polysaccharide monooxygenase [Actinocorallia populi]